MPSHAAVTAGDGDKRQGAEILNASHPRNIVGRRKYEVFIIIEERIVAMA